MKGVTENAGKTNVKKSKTQPKCTSCQPKPVKVKMPFFPSICRRSQGRGAAIQKPEMPPRHPDWMSNLSKKVVDIQRHEKLTKQLSSFFANKEVGELS